MFKNAFICWVCQTWVDVFVVSRDGFTVCV